MSLNEAETEADFYWEEIKNGNTHDWRSLYSGTQLCILRLVKEEQNEEFVASQIFDVIDALFKKILSKEVAEFVYYSCVKALKHVESFEKPSTNGISDIGFKMNKLLDKYQSDLPKFSLCPKGPILLTPSEPS